MLSGMSDDASTPLPADAEPEGKTLRQRKRDLRRQWTITSSRITPEFRTAVRKAAERAGLSQAEWMVDRLHRAAIDELKRETLPGPTLDDTAKMLEEIRARLDEPRLDPRLDEIAEGLKALDGKLEGRARADGRIAAMMDYLVEVRNEVQQARQELAAVSRRRGVLSRLFGRD